MAKKKQPAAAPNWSADERRLADDTASRVYAALVARGGNKNQEQLADQAWQATITWLEERRRRLAKPAVKRRASPERVAYL